MRAAASTSSLRWIRGFRTILVRQYFGVDIEVVRDVVKTHPSSRPRGPTRVSPENGI
jgi:uncharacterized protein YutE (UPF0331/DUF86 family)